jgi:hypothetical protein
MMAGSGRLPEGLIDWQHVPRSGGSDGKIGGVEAGEAVENLDHRLSKTEWGEYLDVRADVKKLRDGLVGSLDRDRHSYPLLLVRFGGSPRCIDDTRSGHLEKAPERVG